ncbi:MAG: tetratricopeptide repeat protein [Pseudomonadota bacterium]
MMDQARRHLEAGEFSEAEALFREELEANPENTEATLMLAQLRQQLGDLDEALDLVLEAERLEPFNPNIFHARGVMHINRQEGDEAGRAFRQALDINPNHTASLNGLAFIELAAGRLEAAEHYVDQVLAEDPENAQALTYKGTVVLEQGEPDTAMIYLQEALRVDPESLTAQTQLGRAFLAAGNDGFAAQCFENALQRAPGAADLLEYLGRARLGSGDLVAARTAFHEALEKQRANPDLFRDLAACEVAFGHPGQAEALLSAALQMQPAGSTPRLDLVLPLAELALARGAEKDALGLLQPMADAGADDETLDILLTVAHARCGDPAAAIAAIQPRCNRAGASSAARLAYVQALESDGRHELAAELMEELLGEDDPSPDVLLYRARGLFQADAPSAVDTLQTLVNRPRLDPSRLLQARSMLAQALHAAGRYPEAAGQFEALAHRTAEVLAIDADFEGSGVDATTAMDAGVTADWPRAIEGDERPTPIFVIGWPGSGQERILPALAAHPALRMVMDASERQAERRAHIDRPRGADALATLDEAQLRLRRNRYWKHLEAQGVEPQEAGVLDVLWLTVEALPTIARLFPGATVLVITRDPADMGVAWMMGGYRALSHMAERYANQLALLDQCKDSLPLNFVEIDYDALEAVPETQFEALQSRLGLAPDPAVLERFAETKLPVAIEAGIHRHYAAPSDPAEASPGSGSVH